MTVPRSVRGNFTSRWSGNVSALLNDLAAAIALDLRRPPSNVRHTAPRRPRLLRMHCRDTPAR